MAAKTDYLFPDKGYKPVKLILPVCEFLVLIGIVLLLLVPFFETESVVDQERSLVAPAVQESIALASVILPPPPPAVNLSTHADTQTTRTSVPQENQDAQTTQTPVPQDSQPGPNTDTHELSQENPKESDQAPDAVLEPALEQDLNTEDTTSQEKLIPIENDDHVALEKGRALLRQLENGNGPRLILLWPENVQEAENLYLRLTELGMISALIDQQNRLWRLADPPNQAWQVNTDQYSTLMRRVDGIPDIERMEIQRIHNRHSGLADYSTSQLQAVRVMPREIDARLLGNLYRRLEHDLSEVNSISGRYVMQSNQISVLLEN